MRLRFLKLSFLENRHEDAEGIGQVDNGICGASGVGSGGDAVGGGRGVNDHENYECRGHDSGGNGGADSKDGSEHMPRINLGI